MNKLKKIITLALALCMVVSLAACGGTKPAETTKSAETANAADDKQTEAAAETTAEAEPDYDRSVTVGINMDPVTLGPWETQTKGRELCLTTVYQALAPSIVNPETGKMELQYALITDYEQKDDVTYVIHLREGIHDTEGNPFTADDVVFCVNKALELGNLTKVKSVASVTAVDDTTVEFNLSKAMIIGGFEEILTEIWMVTEEAYTASPDGMATKPVGTTGYVMDSYTSGSSISFKKSEIEYWNEKANQDEDVEAGYCYLYDTKNVDNIEYQFITDTSTMAVALQTGQIDMTNSVASADLALFQEGGQYADQFTVFKFPDSQITMAPNCSESSVCSNYNMRMALFTCWDSKDCLDLAYGEGIVLKNWGTPYKSDYDTKYDNAPYFEKDMTKAKEYLDKYLKESGKSASDIHIKLLVQNKKAFEKVALVIQAGIIELLGSDSACEVVSLEEATLSDSMNDPTAFDLAITSGGAEQTYSVTKWDQTCNAKKTATGMAIGFIDDQKLQDLLKTASDMKTHSIETVDAFQDYVNENAYHVGICCGRTYMVAANFVETLLKGPKACIAVTGLHYNWAEK